MQCLKIELHAVTAVTAVVVVMLKALEHESSCSKKAWGHRTAAQSGQYLFLLAQNSFLV